MGRDTVKAAPTSAAEAFGAEDTRRCSNRHLYGASCRTSEQNRRAA